VASPLTVVALADTHLRSGPDGTLSRWLPPAAEAHLRAADVILHLGDLVGAAVLDRLRTYAPVHAVLGNNDAGLERILPPQLCLELGGVRVGMIHDSGPSAGRAGRMRRRFPEADVVAFGHSHAPLVEEGVDGQMLFNPGSPTQRRAQPSHSLGIMEIERARVRRLEVVLLD
jgi:putative phosphoesterase